MLLLSLMHSIRHGSDKGRRLAARQLPNLHQTLPVQMRGTVQGACRKFRALSGALGDLLQG